MLTKARKMKSLSDDDESELSQESGSGKGVNTQPAWMRNLLSSVDNWLQVLPSVSIILPWLKF